MGAESSHASQTQFGANPPSPALTLRVGISGHRPKPDKLPPESVHFVQQRLREVFAVIDAALFGVLADHGQCFCGGPSVRLVSGLAEGADQFAVDAMPATWTLDAVLPFPRNEFEKDFGQLGGDREAAVARYRMYLQRTDATVTELPNERLSNRANGADGVRGREGDEDDPAYSRLGGFLLRQIDILVAVWDGKAEDKKGGTAEVVRAAAGAAIPTVWIHSLRDTSARMIEGLDKNGAVLAPAADCCGGALRDAIEAVVGLPSHDASLATAGDDNAILDRLEAYRAESWPASVWSFVYDVFKRGVEGKPPRLALVSDSAELYRARWAPAPEDDAKAGPLRDRLERVLLPRYAWADALAVAYSHRYRSAYLGCYLLAAVAVAIALRGFFLHHGDGFLDAKAVLVLLELLVIGAIVSIVIWGRRARWKEKWIEYRSLAELLFNVRFLSYLAEHGRTQGALGSSSAGWPLWYLKATIREIGLPHAVLDGTYQRAVLGALDAHVVAPQRQWHLDNARTLQRMHAVLHRAGELCFLLTAVLLGLFLTAFGWTKLSDHALARIGPLLEKHALDLTFYAAWLPALGAAVAGIRETGDFEKVAERSHKTAAALAGLSSAINTARKNLTLDETGDVLLRAALILTEDLGSWQTVYGDKRLELPS